MGRSRVKWGKMDDTSSPETDLSRTENGPLQVGREDVDGDNFSQQSPARARCSRSSEATFHPNSTLRTLRLPFERVTDVTKNEIQRPHCSMSAAQIPKGVFRLRRPLVHSPKINSYFYLAIKTCQTARNLSPLSSSLPPSASSIFLLGVSNFPQD